MMSDADRALIGRVRMPQIRVANEVATRYLRSCTGSGASPEAISLASQAIPRVLASLSLRLSHSLAAWSDAHIATYGDEVVGDALRAAYHAVIDGISRVHAVDLPLAVKAVREIEDFVAHGVCERGKACNHHATAPDARMIAA